MNDINTLQFVLLAIAFISGTMIALQAFVRRSVWTPYLILFFGSTIGFAATVALR